MRKVVLLVFIGIFYSSCATIFGGSTYYAKINVTNDPLASIEYNGNIIGTGSASIKIKRIHADKIAFTIKKEGCTPETKRFTQKDLRGWAFFGSLIGWTGFVPGTFIPIPWGIAIDAATGAQWKPSVDETGISKQDYKNFVYSIPYSGCSVPKEQIIIQNNNQKSKVEQLRELKSLLDQGIITQSEFDSEKKKILDRD